MSGLPWLWVGLFVAAYFAAGSIVLARYGRRVEQRQLEPGSDPFTFRVDGLPVAAPRRLLLLMAGAVPPADFSGNGCGPKLHGTWAGRMLSRVVPDGLHSWSFALPCWFHDYAYGCGGGAAARRAADWNLSRNIVTAISEGGGSASAPRIFGIALLYWLGVRSGGWMAFRRSLSGNPRRRSIGKVVTALELPLVAARLAWAVL